MQASARILLFSAEGSDTDLDKRLNDRGFSTVRVQDRSEALRRLAHSHADVAIVPDGSGAAEGLRRDLDTLGEHRTLPVIALGHDADQVPESDIDVIARPFAEAELFRRLGSLSRLVTMQDELERRAATNASYGVKSRYIEAVVEDASEPRVLTAPANADDAGLCQQALEHAAMLATCEQAADAPTRLMRGDFDALILWTGEDAQESLYLCGDLRSNSRFYNTPILLLADEDQFESPEVPYEAGASDVVYRPVSPELLRVRCLRLVKQHRYRLAMQRVLAACRDQDNQDSLTGLYNHGYLHDHLDRQIASARTSGKALSVGVFRVANMQALNRAIGYGAGDHLLRQVGSMLRGLVRIEDLPARLDGRRFGVVLPDTPRDAALPVLHRLAGVVNHTEFALADGETPIRVELLTGCAELAEGDDAQSLLRRAREAVDA